MYEKTNGEDGVLQHFLAVTKVPRPSGDCRKIADFIEDFARRHGFPVYRDAHDNVLFTVPATAGYENQPTVVLQGHGDMVCASAEGVRRDVANCGVLAKVEDGFVFADGTTLGADDGAAIAMMLALAESGAPHPPLECLVTSDEETGLYGAKGFDTTKLTGTRLVNLDSEEEGIFTVGCAGGCRCDIALPATAESCNLPAYRLEIAGLAGGHSGTEIDKGRTNALKLLGRLLCLATECGGRVSQVFGGEADNAIAKRAVAVIGGDAAFEKTFAEKLNLQKYEGEIPTVSLQKCGDLTTVLDKNVQNGLISLLEKIPYGVICMSQSIPNLVETSANPGVLKTLPAALLLSVSVRSSVAKEKARVTEDIRVLSEEVGATFETRGEYPAWEYRENAFLSEMTEAYAEYSGKAPVVSVIHAGLECGILTDKAPNLSCVSIGPDVFGAHTPAERMSLASFYSVYRFLKYYLAKRK